MASAVSTAPPKPKMSGLKRAFSYAIAAIFDFLKFIFVMFIFTAPLILGASAAISASQNSWLSWIPSWVVATAVTGGVAGLEILQPQIAAAITAFGLVMATAVGFAGGLFLALWFWLFCGIPPWKKGGGSLLIGWGASLIPFIDMLPTLTLGTWGIVRSQHKADREALKKWEQEQAKQQKSEREQAGLQEIQQAQQTQAQIARMRAEAANDNEEIPDEMREAA